MFTARRTGQDADVQLPAYLVSNPQAERPFADHGTYSPKGWDINASHPIKAGKSGDSNLKLHPFGEAMMSLAVGICR